MVSSTSVTLQWGPVECRHRNGEITGYSVQYEMVGSGNRQTVSVVGDTATETTISGLESSSNYSIRVAAVNRVGTGVHSNLFVETLDSECLSLHSSLMCKSLTF